MTAPTILLEAYLGGAWQDLTGSLLASHGRGVRISRGRANEAGSAQPGRCEFALESRTGEWTEGSPASHPDWAAGARVRVTVNGTVRFAGTISSPVTRWPDREDALHAVTTVTATDVIADLAADQLMVQPATLLLAGLGATALWPLDDPAGSTLARSLVPGVPPLEFGTNLDGHPLDPQTLYGFGVSAPEGGPRAGSWLGLTPAIDGPPLWHAWATPQGTRQLPSSAVPVTVLGWHTRTTAPLEVTTLLMRLGPIAVYQLTDGYLQLEYASTATLAGATPLDTPVLLALVVTATTATLHSSAGGSVSVAVDPGAIDYPWFEVGASPSYGDPGSTGLWSNIATVPAVLSLADVWSLAGRAAGLLGAPVSSWLAAAAGEAVQVLGYDRPMLAPATHGASAAGVGDSLADVAGAMWVADRASDQPTWIDPRWVGPVTALPGEAVDLDRLEWAADRSLRVTDVTSEGRLLASSGLTPRVTRDLAPLLRPIDLQGRAEWLANTGGVMGSPRLGGVGVDLLTWPWETSQLNLASANSGFEGVGSIIEIWRNHCLNPRQVSGGSTSEFQIRYGWAPSYLTGIVIPGSGLTTAARSTCPSNMTDPNQGVNWGGNVQLGSPLTSGDWLNYPMTPDVPMKLFTWVRLGLSGNVTVRLRYHDGAGNWVGASQSPLVVPLTAGVWTAVSVPSFTPPAGATHAVFGMFLNATSGTFPAGVAYDQTGCCVTQQAAPAAWFDSGFSPDPDLTAYSVGTPDSSPSRLSGNAGLQSPGVPWAVGAGVKAFAAQSWAGHGVRSGRAVCFSPDPDTTVRIAGAPNASGQLYTVLLTLRSIAPTTVSVRFTSGGPEVSLWSGTVDGVQQVRATYVGNGAADPRFHIYLPNVVGAQVWWDDLAVVEGDYFGSWFPDALPGTADLLALDLRHRVRISDPPPQVPSVLRTTTVEGYEETIALDQWGLTLNLAPDPRGIWGDPVQGVLGAAADNRYGT